MGKCSLYLYFPKFFCRSSRFKLKFCHIVCNTTMVNIRSSEFGAFWKSMFMVATSIYEKFDPNNSEHVQQQKNVKAFMTSLFKVLPCSVCRSYTQEVLLRIHPLDYSGRRQLMLSLYCIRDAVNHKLLQQGKPHARKSPPFETVYKKYTSMIVQPKSSRGRNRRVLGLKEQRAKVTKRTNRVLKK